MAIKKIVPYGNWESTISAETATAGSRALNTPRACPKTKRAFFIESRTDGTNGIVELTHDGTKHVLPDEFSASSIVYEYGGMPYAVVPGDNKLRIIFSDSANKTLSLLDVDSGTVELILASPTLRYADFDCHPKISDGSEEHAWVVAIEEDHINPKPADVKNYVVAINLVTKEVKRAVEGADFYTYPRFSPDGEQLAWLQWSHPDLPFRGVKLYLGDFDSSCGKLLSSARHVAGDEGDSIAEPRWSPGGQLYFCSDKSEFSQLCKFHEGSIERILSPGLEDAEIAVASWTPGRQSYVFLTETTIIAAIARFGTYILAHIDIETKGWTELDAPLHDLHLDCLARESTLSVIAIGSGYTRPTSVYRITIMPDDLSSPGGWTVAVGFLYSSVDKTLHESVFSTPEHIRFTTTLKAPEREVHGFIWLPHNPKFMGPDGTLPPLIVRPHGGPTGHTPPGLDMTIQYFTSRGYAYFAINYTGSSAHGKAYRDALFGEWGILDRDDAAEAVHHLSCSGRIDGSRVGIEGGSAGGYNVLCSLTWYPEFFAGGVCFCGVSDIKALDAETHKMESHYVEALLNLEGLSDEEKDDLFRSRSPLYHAEKITTPLLLVHGDEDPVVPISQSREIKRKIESRRGGDDASDVELIVLKGEGHNFHRAESWLTIILEGERWWRKTLLRR
ncbi:peptidase S9 prolyl oligopeptidase active site-containing protein [Podospora didyma]|uniref:Peptidase S9 prolyl oligopeptidase active site-containing protein n=1 Tax=Podospora didyma TaxID=330526 RepID=A0AAE0KJB2_9PEZI|nr:peptidase S9 prolyl oligopeptidase active site-containing protein [Podospora didyma]